MEDALSEAKAKIQKDIDKTEAVEKALRASMASSASRYGAYTTGGTVIGSSSTSTISSGTGVYTTGGITYFPTTSTTTPFYDTTIADKMDAMEKKHKKVLDDKDKQIEDLKKQLRLSKTQLALQLDENDELVEKEAMFQANLRTIESIPHGDRVQNVLDHIKTRYDAITDNWIKLSDDSLDEDDEW